MAYIKIISLAAAVAALVNIFVTIFYRITAVDAIGYKIFLRESGRIGVSVPLVLGGASVLVLWLLKQKTWRETLMHWEKIFRPALLLWLIPADGFPGILAAILIISLVAFDLGGQLKFQLPELSDKCAVAVAWTGAAVLAGWGYFLQIKALDTQYFIWSDWNHYAEHYQHLLSGKAAFIHWFSGAGHWNFGVNLLMTAALKIWYAPDMIFLINAICIASTVPLGYFFCRKCGLNNWLSLIFLPLTALNPVLSNQYLSLFYGFHPIIFFIPVIFGFFIARECGCRWMMTVMFLLSLMIQETVCIFWAGYAIYLLCCKKWKSALILFGAMAGTFFFFSSVVIPAAHDVVNYSQMFKYLHLGNSLFEVMLSPVRRPAEFWGTIFERSSICLGLSLLVPLFWGVIFKPAMLLALVPILAGVVLQGSADVKSIMLQYGLECTVFGMIVMVLNWKRIYPELRRPSALAVLVATCLSGWLLGMLPGRNGEFDRLMERPDGRGLINYFDQAAQGAKRIVATGRLRGQFQFMYPSAFYYNGYRPGDVILLDLHDSAFDRPDELEKFRRQLAADRRVVPVLHFIWENHTIVMFRVLDKAVELPGIGWLRPVADADFARAGGMVRSDGGEYELRYALINGKNVYRVRLNKAVGQDIEFSIWQRDIRGGESEAVVLFGNGLFPAYSVKPGTMFEFVIPGLPAERIRVNSRRR